MQAVSEQHSQVTKKSKTKQYFHVFIDADNRTFKAAIPSVHKSLKVRMPPVHDKVQ